MSEACFMSGMEMLVMRWLRTFYLRCLSGVTGTGLPQQPEGRAASYLVA